MFALSLSFSLSEDVFTLIIRHSILIPALTDKRTCLVGAKINILQMSAIRSFSCQRLKTLTHTHMYTHTHLKNIDFVIVSDIKIAKALSVKTSSFLCSFILSSVFLKPFCAFLYTETSSLRPLVKMLFFLLF